METQHTLTSLKMVQRNPSAFKNQVWECKGEIQTPLYMKRSIPGEKDKFAVSHDFLLSRSVFLA